MYPKYILEIKNIYYFVKYTFLSFHHWFFFSVNKMSVPLQQNVCIDIYMYELLRFCTAKNLTLKENSLQFNSIYKHYIIHIMLLN